MKSFTILVLSLLAAGLFNKYRHREITIAVPQTAALDACNGKEKCAVIYLAPWCPSCRSQMPGYKNLLTLAHKHENYGVKILVGAGESPAQNNGMVQELGAGAVADDDGRLKTQLGVNKFPSYFILDQSGRVAMQDIDAMNWINSQYSGR